MVQQVGLEKPPTSQPQRMGMAEGVTNDQNPTESDRVNALAIPFGVPLELDSLITEDSDTEKTSTHLTRRASTALDMVRSKITRHITAKHCGERQSQMSVRNSQEEIARRAELRRLRRRRIQDELHYEGGSDDVSSMSRKSLRQPLSLISLHQACIGPRDFIEFTVSDKSPHTIDGEPPKCSIKPTDSPETERKLNADSLGSTSEFLPTNGAQKEEPLWPAYLRQDLSPDVQLCLPGDLSTQSLELKQPAHTDLESSATGQSHLGEDDQSTLGVWLIAQAMQTEETTVVCGDSEGTVVHKDKISQHDNRGGDMDCVKLPHRRTFEASDTSHEKFDQIPGLSTTNGEVLADQCGVDCASNSEADTESDMLQFFPIIARSLLGEPVETVHPTANPNSKHVLDSSSSKYNSLRPSFQPSPSRSQPNMHDLSLRDLRSLDLSPFRCKLSLIRSQISSLTHVWVI